jgi:aromatic-L-amino-acid decarboxylase
MDVGLALGRRFRALKPWFVFRWYGAEGLRQMIRRHCELAAEFAERVMADDRLELAAPVTFSTVCFRAIAPGGVDETEWNEKLLARVNSAGNVFLSHTELDGRYTIRMSVGNVNTEQANVDGAWESVLVALEELRSNSA